jgi:signal transduction histidine kinase
MVTTMTSTNPRPERARVLCVDDDPEVLAALQMTLRRRFDVTTAENGPDGLRVLAEQGPFTVVVSDFSMPGMNGAQFLSRVRQEAPNTIRMLLTGHASLEGAIDAVNNGRLFRFLTKPCPPRELIAAIDEAIEQDRQAAAQRADLEQKLDAMSAHMRRAERLATLGTMAGAVGHELNNVLMVFAGALSQIEDDMQSGKYPDDTDLDMLRHARDRVAAHASNLLHLGRPGQADAAGKADLGATAAKVVGMLRATGLLKHVDVRLRLPEAPVIVACSANDIEQMLVNLIKNAAEAFAGSETEPRIEVAVDAGATSGKAVCTVSDNGPGIQPATQPMLFEPYYTTKPDHLGSGLGLYVVHEIARRAGGDVVLESPAGGGAMFRVTLPLADASARTGEAA